MSVNIFEDSNLDFDVSIIKTKRELTNGQVETDVESVTPLEPSAVLNLTLRESSINLGILGTITINNKFKILDKLNISTNSPDNIYLAIKITDQELDKIDIGAENKCITVVGFIDNIESVAVNSIDSVLIFSFEEAFVAALRQTQATAFTGSNKITRNGTDVYESESKRHYRITTLLDLFNREFFQLKDGDKIVTNDSSEPNTDINIQSAIDDEQGEISSVYDAVAYMLRSTGVEVSNGGIKTPYLRLVNTVSDSDDGGIVRKIKFAPFFSQRHKEFVQAILDGNSDGDFSDVYLEKFFLGPLADVGASADVNTKPTNSLETYDIIRANVGKLRDTVWGDYRYDKSLQGNDKAIFSPLTKTFYSIVLDYIETDLNDLKVGFNLPMMDPKSLKEFSILFNSSTDNKETAISLKQQDNMIVNKVNKSFFTISETITFKVKGSIFRQPNKFVWLEDNTSDDYKKLWYVNSVEHEIAGGRYTNTITATKLFGNTEKEAIFSEADASEPLPFNDNLDIFSDNLINLA